MANYDIEKLKQADEAYADAGAYNEKAYWDFESTQAAEVRAAAKLEDEYRIALMNGFIIESITDPSKVKYFAGMIGEDSCSLMLDNKHAASLKGVLAINASPRVRNNGLRTAKELALKVPQILPSVTFEVPGIRDNQKIRDNITRFDWMGENTAYEGELAAIEWRLPTEAEIEQFAGATAVAAA